MADEIAALLADAQRVGSLAPRPRGWAAVFIQDVESRGGDLDAVTEWVRQRGGELIREPGQWSQTVPRRRRSEDSVYFVIPPEAMAS